MRRFEGSGCVFLCFVCIAVLNGVVMVSYIRDLQREGLSLMDATEKGARLRLRAVLMTALTTGLGLIPLVIGGYLPGREILFPVATVIVGGLVTSTLCEFFIRPGLFWVFTDPTNLENAAPPGGGES